MSIVGLALAYTISDELEDDQGQICDHNFDTVLAEI
jgi:hypothetical protein